MKISILGGGSWGTALAAQLAKNKHQVKIWEFFEEQARKMEHERVCPLLPEVRLSDNIFVSSKMEEVLPDSKLVFIVVPSDKVEVTISQAVKFLESQSLIICSKGFASNSRLLSEVVQEKVKPEMKEKVYCLYGPTHAEEVGKGKLTGIVLAGGKGKQKIKKVLESENFKVELSKDIVGMQVAAALKNVFAVFIGLLEGLNQGDNAKAYIMTKGLEEIKEVGLAWGAKKETFYGLAGLGDLIVTCTSKHSRNRHVGEEVGKGRKLSDVLAEMKMVAEGVTNLKEAIHLQEKFNLKLPLINGLYEILFEGKEAREVLKEV